MVCNRIEWGKQVLLTVYHKGFDDVVQSKKLCFSEKVGRFNLMFIQETVTDAVLDSLVNPFERHTGMLPPEHKGNPYGSASAQVQHFVYVNKPSRLFSIQGDEYTLSTELENLLKINDFTEKYLGIDLSSSPMDYGDVFVFSAFKTEYHTNQAYEIILVNPPLGSMVIINFKKDMLVVSTKIQCVSIPVNELIIDAEKEWDCHDIEIYKDEKLLYYRKDVSYMRNMEMHFLVSSGIKNHVALRKIANQYGVPGRASEHITRLGEKPEVAENALSVSNSKIARAIKQHNAKITVDFIHPGEGTKALDIIARQMQVADDDIWLFDSYFTDKHHPKEMLDWLHILYTCPARKKTVVFYCRDEAKAYNLQSLREQILADSTLGRLLISNKFKIKFLQTRNPIHDRFLFTTKENTTNGLSIGTSFNSLNDNHYCIHKFQPLAAESILADLSQWMQHGNILESGTL